MTVPDICCDLTHDAVFLPDEINTAGSALRNVLR
jgi:hypothetical protein